MNSSKILPTSKIVDNIINKHIIGKDINGDELKPKKHKGVFDLSNKGHQAWKGKLTPHDVDMIRCLSLLGKQKTHIQKYFGIKTPIQHIVDHSVFSKHLSPFEKVVKRVHFEVDQQLFEEFKEEHQDEIKDFYRFSYEESIKSGKL